jgi:hypothetical protein
MTTPLNGQILSDSGSVILLKKGVEYIYNYQFWADDSIYEILNEK